MSGSASTMPVVRGDVAGSRALVLLKQVSPEAYERIARPTWQKWAPVIVGLPRRGVTRISPDIAQILTDALTYAPAEFVGAVRSIIRLEQKPAPVGPRPRPLFLVLLDLDGCWSSPELTAAISRRLPRRGSSCRIRVIAGRSLKAEFVPAFNHALGCLSERRGASRRSDARQGPVGPPGR